MVEKTFFQSLGLVVDILEVVLYNMMDPDLKVINKCGEDLIVFKSLSKFLFFKLLTILLIDCFLSSYKI